MSDRMAAHPLVEAKPGRRPRLSEQIVAAIRARVVSGDLAPGGKLPTETQLTETFGVSRTVIREAIAKLAADGLVEPRQGAGVFVLARPSSGLHGIGVETGNKISHALNVLEVRMGIEIECAALAAIRRNGAQEAAIQEAFFEFDRLLSRGEATGKSDFAFHRAIAMATNNPYYVEVLEALGPRAIPCDVTSPFGTDAVLTREYQEELQQEHLAILRAISAGDPDTARTAMRAHLSASQLRYRARLYDQQSDYAFGNIRP
jgi:GntR family transcriptional repressor for pyruvate dehydrogenase complex